MIKLLFVATAAALFTWAAAAQPAGSPTPAPSKAPKTLDLSKSVELDATKAKPELKPGEAPGDQPIPARGANPTEIQADEAMFDQRLHVGVFQGTVIVRNDQFVINCDKLTAYLRESGKTPGKKGEKGNPGSPAPATETPAAAATPAPGGKASALTDPTSSPLRKAIAEGSVVIIQDKPNEDGTVQHNVGRAQKATYDSETGDVYLYGKPEVQSGDNRCFALDERTVIILNRDGHMRVHGPHKTIIEPQSAASKDKDNPAAPAPNPSLFPKAAPAH